MSKRAKKPDAFTVVQETYWNSANKASCMVIYQVNGPNGQPWKRHMLHEDAKSHCHDLNEAYALGRADAEAERKEQP